MKILVTGGDGFIGSFLVDELRRQGNDVTVYDAHTTSVQTTEIDRSLGDPEMLEFAVNQSDQVYHLGAVVGVEYVRENLSACLFTNTIGTIMVHRFCRMHRKPVLYTSSSEVYGHSRDDHHFPTFEENQRIVYPLSKLTGELVLRTSDIKDWKIARVFNTIGPRQRAEFGMVVPKFVVRALKGLPLEVHGDGSQVRYFCHVQDTVDQLIDLMRMPPRTVTDVGDTMEVSILELAHMVKELTGSDSEIVNIEKPFGDNYGDLFRIKPSVAPSGRDLVSVLEEIIEWWKKEL